MTIITDVASATTMLQTARASIEEEVGSILPIEWFYADMIGHSQPAGNLSSDVVETNGRASLRLITLANGNATKFVLSAEIAGDYITQYIKREVGAATGIFTGAIRYYAHIPQGEDTSFDFGLDANGMQTAGDVVAVRGLNGAENISLASFELTVTPYESATYPRIIYIFSRLPAVNPYLTITGIGALLVS